MKKHAKKSLLIPILALVSVVAIAACCYLAQTFNAFAEDEVDAAAVEAPVPNPSDQTFGIIHLNTGDIFSGTVYGAGDPEPYLAIAGEKVMTYSSDVTNFSIEQAKGGDDSQVIVIEPNVKKSETNDINQICTVNLSYTFFEYVGATVNYRWADNTWDITINVTPKYYIGFNANGGKFLEDDSEDTIKWIAQGEYNSLKYPGSVHDTIEPDREGYSFAGWYTQPWGGQLAARGSQLQNWGEPIMLFAHWVEDNQRLNIHIETPDYSLFRYVLFNYDNTSEVYDTGITWSYTIPQSIGGVDYRPLSTDKKFCFFNTFGHEYYETPFEYDKVVLCLEWYKIMEYDYVLAIYPLQGQRIDSVSLNGGNLPFGAERGSFWEDFQLDWFNNFELGISNEVSGYISVATDNGKMFECEVAYYNDLFGEYGDIVKSYKFVSDNVPIFVGPSDYVFYAYGIDSKEDIGLLNFSNDEYRSNASFSIIVRNPRANPNPEGDRVDGSCTVYTFRDNLASIFDWLNLNSYILGANVDGQAVPIGDYKYYLPNGYHNVELNMTSEPSDTTVTYKANGGKFADDSDTMILDARFGEPLPIVKDPNMIDYKFAGWYTEPEGGVLVEPQHFIWMPWQRETGVTLYAHWAYNPQPVPPEPVPPTPDPVNPDVPGGGGTAQTGDSMPLVPIAALAVIAALGCGLAIRKEYF